VIPDVNCKLIVDIYYGYGLSLLISQCALANLRLSDNDSGLCDVLVTFDFTHFVVVVYKKKSQRSSHEVICVACGVVSSRFSERNGNHAALEADDEVFEQLQVAISFMVRMIGMLKTPLHFLIVSSQLSSDLIDDHLGFVRN
jgi:hypothetical protein